MSLANLTQLEILQGTFALIHVLIASIVGIRIILKAFKLNRSELITVGLTWVLIASAWWGVSFQFITYGFFNYRLTDFQYLLVANVFIPMGLICWGYSFCEVVNPDLKKNFFLGIIIFVIVWELFIWISFAIDTKLVGTIDGIFDSTHSRIQLIFIMSAVFIFVITGIIFSLKSMKVDNPEIKWKGKFLLLAWILFPIGALLDAALVLNAVTLILIRLILIISSICFELGFFLPEFLKNKLIKQ